MLKRICSDIVYVKISADCIICSQLVNSFNIQGFINNFQREWELQNNVNINILQILTFAIHLGLKFKINLCFKNMYQD